MKAVLETDHSLTAGEGAGHLDRVLNRLGAAVQQESALRMAAGSDLVEPFGQGDVGLVCGDRKAYVSKTVQLGPDGRNNRRVPVPGIDHADPAAEIDQPVAVSIGDDRSVRLHYSNRGDGRYAPRHRLGAPCEQGAALGAGDLRHEPNDARHLHSGKGLQDVREKDSPLRWSIHQP